MCLWGLAPVATRALLSQLAPLALLTMRQLLAASVLLPWAVPVVRRIGARNLPRFAVAGLLGMIGYNLPVTVGLQWLPASSAACCWPPNPSGSSPSPMSSSANAPAAMSCSAAS